MLRSLFFIFLTSTCVYSVWGQEETEPLQEEVLDQEALKKQEILEQQELKYTKALIFFNDKKDGHALELLYQNLDKGMPPHLQSFDLMVNILEKRAEFLKAIRIQYLAIKKLHTTVILRSKNLKTVRKWIEREDKMDKIPGDEIKNLYLRLADLLFKLNLKTSNSNEKLKKVTNSLAQKYFNVCLFYNFQKTTANYSLALLERANRNYYDAIPKLLEAEDDLKNNFPEEKELRQTVGLYLADSYLQIGSSDISFSYLKTLNGPQVDPAVKQYAQLYTDSLTTSQLYLNAQANYGYDSNVWGLTDRNRDNFEPFAPFLESTEGYFYNRTVSGQLVNFPSKNVSNFFNFELGQTNYVRRIQRTNDSRYISLFDEISIRSLKQSALRFSYGATFSFSKKDLINEHYSYDGIFQQFKSTYERWFRWGTLTFALPFKLSQSQSLKATSFEYGGTAGLIPIAINRYISPSFAFTASQVSGGAVGANVTRYYLSTTNQTRLNDKWAIFSTFIYNKDHTSLKSSQLQYYAISLISLFDLSKFVSNLLLKISYDQSFAQTDTALRENVKRKVISSGLTVNF